MGTKIGAFGRMYVSTNKVVFVASNPNCPKMVLAGNSSKLRDDYNKEMRIGRNLLKKFAVL